jgi:hypothetical protein
MSESDLRYAPGRVRDAILAGLKSGALLPRLHKNMFLTIALSYCQVEGQVADVAEAAAVDHPGQHLKLVLTTIRNIWNPFLYE